MTKEQNPLKRVWPTQPKPEPQPQPANKPIRQQLWELVWLTALAYCALC